MVDNNLNEMTDLEIDELSDKLNNEIDEMFNNYATNDERELLIATVLLTQGLVTMRQYFSDEVIKQQITSSLIKLTEALGDVEDDAPELTEDETWKNISKTVH